jgi:hypothetical protein
VGILRWTFLARELCMLMISIVIHDVYEPRKIFFGTVAQVSTKAEENIRNIVRISKKHRVVDIFTVIIVSQCLFHIQTCQLYRLLKYIFQTR